MKSAKRFIIVLIVVLIMWPVLFLCAAEILLRADEPRAAEMTPRLPPRLPEAKNRRPAEWTLDPNDWDGLFRQYQIFLHEKDHFPTRHRKGSEEEKREKLENHRRRAVLCEKFAKALEEAIPIATDNDKILQVAPPEIKKEKDNLLRGSWNLYKNIPPNALDLWREACWLRFCSLKHQADADASRSVSTRRHLQDQLDRYVDGLRQYPDLADLYKDTRRSTELRPLYRVREELKELFPDEKPEPANNETENSSEFVDSDKAESDKPDKQAELVRLADEFDAANRRFAGLLLEFPGEDNLHVFELMLELQDKFRSLSPQWISEETIPAIAGPLRETISTVRSKYLSNKNDFEASKIEVDGRPIRQYVDLYEGMLRRQELLGDDMPIWGADPDGKSVDPKWLENKIVLLDFWATWCGPCVAEFPHLKLLYEKYHDKGFEIVGYSADADLEKLRAFLKKNPLPWIVLSKTSTDVIGLPSLTDYYGARRLPVVLLRDRKGKAILLDARGDKLDEMLEKIFAD